MKHFLKFKLHLYIASVFFYIFSYLMNILLNLCIQLLLLKKKSHPLPLYFFHLSRKMKLTSQDTTSKMYIFLFIEWCAYWIIDNFKGTASTKRLFRWGIINCWNGFLSAKHVMRHTNGLFKLLIVEKFQIWKFNGKSSSRKFCLQPTD